MYTSSIIWLLMWPVVIILSYYAIKWMLRKFEKNLAKEDSSIE